MNILPKKSWHVLSRKNIEKVRSDEAEAKAREEELAQRAALAEQEARVRLMRKRAREREGLPDLDEEEGGREAKGEVRADGHINFFADLESGVGLKLTNAEHEAEKKADQEKLEKRIGLLNYLVDKDKSDPEPWYMRKSASTESKSSSGASAKAEHRKEVMDPLHSMKGYVAAKKKCVEVSEGRTVETRLYEHREKHRERGRDRNTDIREGGTSDRDSRDSSKDGKLSGKKKHKHKHKAEKKANLEKLRRERRKREEAENIRVEALLRQHYGVETASGAPSSGPQAVEELPGRYNSQFNPHLARH